MCGLAILSSVVLFPLAGIGFVLIEQEFKAAFKQRKQFNRQIDEMEAIMARVRSNYDKR